MISAEKCISAEQCRDYSAQCLRLGQRRDISIEYATTLMAMHRTWDFMASQIDRLASEKELPPALPN